MTGRLIYVVGPSGAGKDSLLGWLREHLPPDAGIAFARRTITRPSAGPGDEQHEAMAVADFARLRDAGGFAIHWEANGLHYGVRDAELNAHRDGRTVVVNGSRAYLAEAMRRVPTLTVVHVTAGIETLRRRLLERGRESPAQVSARVQRAIEFRMPAGIDAIEILNDDSLAVAGARLLQAICPQPATRDRFTPSTP